MADFTIKANDRKPDLVVLCLDAAGAAVDLTTASSVKLIMSSSVGATPKVDAAATITDAATGEVTYAWQAGDTDTPGRYIGEIEVTWSVGVVQTFPSDGFLDIRVAGELG